MIKIQIKRGSKVNLPDLANGEYGITTDTDELFIGGSEGNLQIPLLGADGKLPEGYLPSDSEEIQEISEQVQGVSDDLAALKLNIEQWWDYLEWRYGCETVIEDGDGSTYAKKFTDTIKNGETVVATCVTTKAMTGTQFVSVYTIGKTVRTYTETKDESGKWTGVWS